MAELIRGVILHDSVLFPSTDLEQIADQNAPSLPPLAQSLLRRLHHSDIRTGISYGKGLSEDKMNLLKEMVTQHDCFLFNASSTDAALDEIGRAWGDIGGNILLVVSNRNKDAFNKLSCSGLIIVLSGGPCENPNMLHVNGLEELPLVICRLNREALGNKVVTVGYTMKPSREEDFAKRGAFPMCPTPNGLMFLPLMFEVPLSSQLQNVDVVLHKATDEIMSVQVNSSSTSSIRINYTPRMQEMQQYMEQYPHCVAVDSIDSICPVLDRLKIQDVLLGLEELNTAGHSRIRRPNFVKVDNFNKPDLAQKLSEAKLSLPAIVKPQIACGVADAHSMAIVFQVENFKYLSIPLPAVIQEYVDHASTLFKFYVLGEQVYHAVKNSIPNADALRKTLEENGRKPILFDSLKSLPSGSGSGSQSSVVDLGLVTDAAKWLRRKLDLTIFGFDVVIQEGSGDHVIVDVNYLPSFKEVPDDTAIPAFWEAIGKRFESKKKKP